MTGREQLIWASSYASLAGDSANAVRWADQAIRELRELNSDNERHSGPEYEAARHGPGLTFEEFRAWYPVALKIAKKGIVTRTKLPRLHFKLHSRPISDAPPISIKSERQTSAPTKYFHL